MADTSTTVEKIATADHVEFWNVKGEVYRAPLGAKLDTWNLPMGRRWECSYTHWMRYRLTAYGWAADCHAPEEK